MSDGDRREPHTGDRTGGAAHVTRVCFRLQVAAEHMDAYRERHAAVWPDMLRAIASAGRRNYSLFLDDDGLLIGYYETDSVADADASLAASEVATAWESHMQDLFTGATGRADQAARVLPEVFNLEDQLAAARG
ncbi:L-rhamnose mutarotase [Curtobacterium pusillum]|nr:L-rhamnose mutarotase [Curtobacterium pusillum]GLK31445.1 L-rhamnose mutarotase [Curtobacterium pusillum]